nr:helix-turn-helix domain-containing protein [uncultured Carboxylicivirga sp.]
MASEFISRLKQEIQNNIENENFGVSELAEKVGMSRSNLLRRIQKEEGCSASQFIRRIRLQEAINLLKTKDRTVSEISYLVGFSSTSYFIKCFREEFGYPPGEYEQHQTNLLTSTETTAKQNILNKLLPYITGLLIIITIVSILIIRQSSDSNDISDKSLAVLPFMNDSSDSTNLYLINGMMEAILNNLQSIKDVKVVSRTSVEKFRNSNMTIPEIAKALGVKYIVEGSGQKINDQILLSVQLIEAKRDKHLWSEQYKRQTADIFSIQMEIAKKIADEIEVIISPEEIEQIEHKPTNNMEAYDLYLKGLHFMNKENIQGLKKGISLMKQAVRKDPEFALAYSVMAISYYYLDMFEPGKTHVDSLIYFADKALLSNPKLAVALNAKALYYIRNGNYQQAVEYLEKALQYNPNSATVINTLSDLYTNHLPDTEKYLEYALKGIRLDIASYDSITTSYIYLHLSNALIQTGFVDEAIVSINKSLRYNPNNLFSDYVKAYILYAKNKDLNKTQQLLFNTLVKDTTRFDIIQEMGNICYYQERWSDAAVYFDKFIAIRNYLQTQSYIHKNAEIAYVYRKLGRYIDAEKLIIDFKEFAEQDQSIYKNLHWSAYYAYMNNFEKAIKHLQMFAKEENIQIWVPLFTPIDPMYEPIKERAEFKEVMTQIENKFWENHQHLNTKLEKEDLFSIIN